jgi:hypothetical protein
VQLRQLLRGHVSRGTGQWVRGALRLGEGHHLAVIVLLGQERYRAVDPGGEAAVGRRPLLERLQHVPEPPLSLLRPDPQHVEHLLLHLATVNTDAAAAQLPAVAH